MLPLSNIGDVSWVNVVDLSLHLSRINRVAQVTIIIENEEKSRMV